VATASSETPGRPGAGGRPSRPSPYAHCSTHPTDLLWYYAGSSIALTYAPTAEAGPFATATQAATDLRPHDPGDATGWQACRTHDGDRRQWFLRDRPADPTPALLHTAQQQLRLPAPDLATSPPVGAEVIPVGLPVWFWVEDFEPRAERAEVPGAWVEVRAEPVTTRLTITEPWVEDGERTTRTTTVDCHGPGRAWDVHRDDPWDDSGCSHAYRWAGATTVEATVTWRLTWSGSTGAAGALPTVARTTTLHLTLTALEAATN